MGEKEGRGEGGKEYPYQNHFIEAISFCFSLYNKSY